MEHFIETVHKFPCLWNTKAIEYRDQELKDAAWAEVMKETDLSSVKETKLKWKKLRDSYRDALKRQSEMKENPSKKNYFPWKYMGLMQFLQPHMSARKKQSKESAPPPPSHGQQQNGAEARSSDESDSGEESGAGAGAWRRSDERLAVIERQLDYLCKANAKRPWPYADEEGGGTSGTNKRECLDPLDVFFSSMCQSTKRLPYATQIRIRRTLFNAVVEAEEALLADHESYASLWARPRPGADSAAPAPPASASSSEPGNDDEDRKPF